MIKTFYRWNILTEDGLLKEPPQYRYLPRLNSHSYETEEDAMLDLESAHEGFSEYGREEYVLVKFCKAI